VISLNFYGKYLDIGFKILLIGVVFFFIYPPISSLTFGISGSIISLCLLAKDLKTYGVRGYNKGLIKRFGLLIILLLLSFRAELIGVLLFLFGYIAGQWYIIMKVWRNKDGTRS